MNDMYAPSKSEGRYSKSSVKPANKFVAFVIGMLLGGFAFLYAGNYKLAILYVLLGVLWVSGFYADSLSFLSQNDFYQYLNVVFGLWCAVHACFIINNDKSGKRAWYSRWYGLSSIVAVIVVPIFIVRVFFFEPFNIPSGSMIPTLPVGSQVIVQKNGYGNYRYGSVGILKTKPSRFPERGEVIVFQYPENNDVLYIQRVIGRPGDTVEYKNKQYFLNGKGISKTLVNMNDEFAIYREVLDKEEYETKIWLRRKARVEKEWSIPEGYYFVSGDNRDNSRDSRAWGLVPEENVVGRLFHVFY